MIVRKLLFAFQIPLQIKQHLNSFGLFVGVLGDARVVDIVFFLFHCAFACDFSSGKFSRQKEEVARGAENLMR